MADDANYARKMRFDGDSGGSRGCVPARAAVAFRLRAKQIFVDIESVCGSTQLERLCRIPGAPKRVKGLILFKGELVPLLCFFGESIERSTEERFAQRVKTDQYVVIFSIRGTSIAVRVDAPPRLCADVSRIENAEGNACFMRRKHLERLFDRCLAQANGITQTGGDSRTGNRPEAESVSRIENNSETGGDSQIGNSSEPGSDSHSVEQETSSAITGSCCAT